MCIFCTNQIFFRSASVCADFARTELFRPAAVVANFATTETRSTVANFATVQIATECGKYSRIISSTRSACSRSRLRFKASLLSRVAIQRLISTNASGATVFILAIRPVTDTIISDVFGRSSSTPDLSASTANNSFSLSVSLTGCGSPLLTDLRTISTSKPLLLTAVSYHIN